MSFIDNSSLEGCTVYNPTRLIFGRSAFQRVGTEVAKLGLQNGLVVIGQGHVKKSGLLDMILETLRANNVKYHIYEGIMPNPTIESVEEGAELIKTNSIDFVLPIGGGSVIDAAKGMAASVGVRDLWAFYMGKEQPTKALPIIVCLTISATATEMNPFTVVTSEKSKLKLGGSSAKLYPHLSFLDPTVQEDIGFETTANGCIDAIIHVTEYMLMSKDGEYESLTLNIDGAIIRTILDCAEKLRADQHDYAARANFCLSATMALNGTSAHCLHGGCWAIHALQHNIGAYFHKCAHGPGLGVMLPAWLSYCERTGKRSRDALRRWAIEVFGNQKDIRLEGALEQWKALMRKWGKPTSIREYLRSAGYDREAEDSQRKSTLGLLVSGFMQFQAEATDYGLSEDDVRTIYEEAW